MKILLVGINAKYIQTNLAIRTLRAYAEKYSEAVRCGTVTIEMYEWNINQHVSAIARGIFESAPNVVLFSVYIWNRDIVFRTANVLRKILPDIIIGFGGPEVSWRAERAFSDCLSVDFIAAGEGEETFREICDAGLTGRAGLCERLSGVPGLYVRSAVTSSDGEVTCAGRILHTGARAPLADLSLIPFPWGGNEIDFDPHHRIVYYESSRGCPFSCAYCLSAADSSVRYYPLERVLRELDWFIEKNWPLVKFVDRTFNIDQGRYLEIWKHIRDHHNGITLFHFEIAAEYLSDEAYAVMETMPEGAVQFEIGIQSTNPETLALVGRPAHTDRLADRIRRIPKNLHTHVDLIAGLPSENLATFANSFDFAFSLGADMLQLGFLKILTGSPMERIARDTSGYVWDDIPPYEVLASPVLSYADLQVLKDVEHLLDSWYNAGLMRNTIEAMTSSGIRGRSAFKLFCLMTEFVRSYYSDGDLFLPRKPVDSFACMAAFLKSLEAETAARSRAFIEWLKLDFLLQGKPGVFPEWYERRYSRKEHDAAIERFVSENSAPFKDRGPISDVNKSVNDFAPAKRTLFARTEYEEFDFYPGVANIERKIFVYSGNRADKKSVKYLNL